MATVCIWVDADDSEVGVEAADRALGTAVAGAAGRSLRAARSPTTYAPIGAGVAAAPTVNLITTDVSAEATAA